MAFPRGIAGPGVPQGIGGQERTNTPALEPVQGLKRYVVGEIYRVLTAPVSR